MSYVAISFWAYTVLVFLVGLVSARFAKNTQHDFYLANRGLGAWVAGLSGAASVESGWVTLGLVGAGYSAGVGVYWVVPATAASFALIWFVLAPRISALAIQQNSVTLTDVLAGNSASACSRAIRYLAVLISVGMLTLYVASQLSASGKLFFGTFGWTPGVGVIVGLLITLTYTLFGGFRAVAWTDVIQAALMFVAMIVVPVVLILHLGGYASFVTQIETIAQSQPGFARSDGGTTGLAWIAFFTLWLGIPLGNIGQPHLIVRLMATRDPQSLFRGGLISVAWVSVLFTGAVTLGIAARCVYGTIDHPESSLLRVAADENLLHGLIGGLVAAAVLAAICSTVDSQLLVAASNVSSDFQNDRSSAEVTVSPSDYRDDATACADTARADIKAWHASDRRWWIDRAAVLLIAGIAGVIGLLNNESIFDFVTKYGFAGLGASFGPALIWRLWDSRGSGDGSVLLAMLGGIATVFLWNIWNLGFYCYNLPVAFAVAMMLGALGRGWQSLTRPDRN